MSLAKKGKPGNKKFYFICWNSSFNLETKADWLKV
jgi:hypothetical protein